MQKQKFFIFVSIFMIAMARSPIVHRAWAATRKCDGTMRSTYTEGVMGSVSNCDREAAAQARIQAQQTGKAPALAAPVPLPGGTPNYFGPEPNFADSPLPAGSIAGITVTNAGSDYTSKPAVTITDLVSGSGASGATATATIDTSGLVTGITILTAGSGYMEPVVTITGGGGTGATATATIGPPFVGGIRKFVDTMPGVGSVNANDLGDYIPVAAKDTTTFPGSDYYQFAVVDYTQQMHKDLPVATQLRGYEDLSPSADGGNHPHYLGPLIIAERDVPVRLKLFNRAKDAPFFGLVDPTVMGAGEGPLGPGNGTYSANRSVLHLHGARTPWISDGTPHQWTTPPGDPSPYKKGDSFQNVPDMVKGSSVACAAADSSDCFTPSDNDGIATHYYTNDQSSRLMWYHDHSYAITRLTVYSGMAAPYILHDSVEDGLISAGILPDQSDIDKSGGADYKWGVPLLIQDKGFVPGPAQLTAQDPTWNWGQEGDLWFPHVYMTNQNPNDPLTGINPFGRWDYGPWFWPPMDPSTLVGQPHPCANNPSWTCPGTPNPSAVPEAWMDTQMVNGTAYPVMQVAPRAYRFRILNASNVRVLNLQLYYAAKADGTVCNGTVSDPFVPGQTQSVCTEVDMVPAVAATSTSPLPPCPTATTISDGDLDIGLATAQMNSAGQPINGTGLQANCYPSTWPTDGRDGGVPDPTTAGPPIIQIGNESGFLPAPVVIPSTPVNYEYNRRSITVTNVSTHGLVLAPAERADIIIDFSQVPPGSRLILYNDAPAPFPGFDSRNDYYTGDPDQTDTGGAPTTVPGYAPNSRTVMQFQVSGTPAAPFDINGLKAAFESTATTTGTFKADQPAPIVPEAAYGSAYNQTYTDNYAQIQSASLTFTPLDASFQQVGSPITVPLIRKAIHELFELDYGRMDAVLGVEMPLTNFTTQTTIPFWDWDPITEIVNNNQAQYWKITHNGVDTHSIHFHFFDVELIDRVGWDGTVRPPDPNEVGWKETIRMNPLEDVIVAMKPIAPPLPFPIPDSIRPLDVTAPIGSTVRFTDKDPSNNPVTVVNHLVNFGWEYMWHCHMLGHEDVDMMRFLGFVVAPEDPSGLTATPSGQSIVLNWTDNSISAMDFTIQRATDSGFTQNLTTFTVGPVPLTVPETPPPTTYTDDTIALNTPYYYRVQAFKTIGDTTVYPAPAVGYPNTTSSSGWSGTAQADATTAIVLSSTALSFGPQYVGSNSVPQTVTVSNTGPTAINITAPGILLTAGNTGDFPISNNCGSNIAGLSSCTIVVTFNPTAAGGRAATLSVNDSDPGSPQTVSLSGTGVATTTSSVEDITPPSSSPHYAGTTLTGGFASAVAGDTIEAMGMLFAGNNATFNINTSGAVTFIGGYDSTFSSASSMTTMQGVLTVGGSGTLIVQNLTIE